MARNGNKRAPHAPYAKPGLIWEDPIDGYGPAKHRSQKKGARQQLAREANENFGERADECEECGRRLLPNEHTMDYAGKDMCFDCIAPFMAGYDDDDWPFQATSKDGSDAA